jgi:hypothetical protein
MTDDESKRIILSRRARFIAGALASAGLAANPACSGDVDESDKVAAGGAGGSGGAGAGGGGRGGTAHDGGNDAPQVCLSPPGGFGGTGAVGGAGGAPFDANAEPVPCLEPPFDAGAEPVPCLSPPLEAEPAPCLKMAPPDAQPPDGSPQPCLTPVK